MNKLPTNNILDLLTAATEIEPAELIEPADAIPAGHIECGVVLSIRTKRLHTGLLALKQEITLLDAERSEYKQEHSDASVCRHFDDAIFSLDQREDIVSKIISSLNQVEYPHIPKDALNIYTGWKLAYDKDVQKLPAQISVALSKSSNVSVGTCIIRILGGETIADADQSEFKPIAKSEQLITEVTDQRLRSFLSLSRYILDEAESRLPIEMQLPKGELDPVSLAGLKKRFEDWIQEQRVGELNDFIAILKHAREESRLAMELFWRGVRDTYPEADKAANLTLRRYWKVASSPVEPEEESAPHEHQDVRVTFPSEFLAFLMSRTARSS